MRYLLLILIIFSTALNALALDIVYPKKVKVNINCKTTFFVGSTDTLHPLIINGEIVPVHPSGGFAHFVQLNHGNNKFIIKSANETKEFNINSTWKAPTKSKHPAPTVTTYATQKLFFTTEDKTPIRTTPSTGGINRIVHLQKDIPLYIDGELGKFYRIPLSDDEIYWVAKSHVKQDPNIPTAK